MPVCKGCQVSNSDPFHVLTPTSLPSPSPNVCTLDPATWGLEVTLCHIPPLSIALFVFFWPSHTISTFHLVTINHSQSILCLYTLKSCFCAHPQHQHHPSHLFYHQHCPKPTFAAGEAPASITHKVPRKTTSDNSTKAVKKAAKTANDGDTDSEKKNYRESCKEDLLLIYL